MAFDGITIAAITHELQSFLINGRISKVAQPEKDELLFTVKTEKHGQKRLLISASASLPLAYLTDNNIQSPMNAPSFCMLLRKHLQNGRILSITQPGLERVIEITVEHMDEMGDLRSKILVCELMGKHSNIILLNDDRTIADSIKHISANISSVREVLPGRIYFLPQTTEKKNPLDTDYESFHKSIQETPLPLSKAIYTNYTGISPLFSEELCARSGLDGNRPFDSLDATVLFEHFNAAMNSIKSGDFSPVICYENGEIKDYCALFLTSYKEYKRYDSISNLLENYYAQKNILTRIRQKSADLRKIVQTALERDVKKYDLQLRQLKDTEKKDKYRIYGELLNTYGYGVEEGAKELEALNYYTNETIKIPLDPQLSPSENAKKYFDKYGKLKRTEEALTELTKEVSEEIEHLKSIQSALDIAREESDLTQIKEELMDYGFIRKKSSSKERSQKSKPLHYITKEGFHIYVGKNNYQNEELTFKIATGNDWWFHAKKRPGSHVIVKTEGKELPDSVFEDAARLAAHYSQGQSSDKIEVDYLQKKNVKKPGGKARPGFVIYYTNYSMLIDTDIRHLSEVTDS